MLGIIPKPQFRPRQVFLRHIRISGGNAGTFKSNRNAWQLRHGISLQSSSNTSLSDVLDLPMSRGIGYARLKSSARLRTLTAFTKRLRNVAECKAACIETRPSRVNGALSQLFGKCNVNYSPADLPPRLLRRYAHSCFGEQLEHSRRKKAKNAARITNSLSMGNRSGDFRYGLKEAA